MAGTESQTQVQEPASYCAFVSSFEGRRRRGQWEGVDLDNDMDGGDNLRHLMMTTAGKKKSKPPFP